MSVGAAGAAPAPQQPIHVVVVQPPPLTMGNVRLQDNKFFVRLQDGTDIQIHQIGGRNLSDQALDDSAKIATLQLLHNQAGTIEASAKQFSSQLKEGHFIQVPIPSKEFLVISKVANAAINQAAGAAHGQAQINVELDAEPPASAVTVKKHNAGATVVQKHTPPINPLEFANLIATCGNQRQGINDLTMKIIYDRKPSDNLLLSPKTMIGVPNYQAKFKQEQDNAVKLRGMFLNLEKGWQNEKAELAKQPGFEARIAEIDKYIADIKGEISKLDKDIVFYKAVSEKGYCGNEILLERVAIMLSDPNIRFSREVAGTLRHQLKPLVAQQTQRFKPYPFTNALTQGLEYLKGIRDLKHAYAPIPEDLAFPFPPQRVEVPSHAPEDWFLTTAKTKSQESENLRGEIHQELGKPADRRDWNLIYKHAANLRKLEYDVGALHHNKGHYNGNVDQRLMDVNANLYAANKATMESILKKHNTAHPTPHEGEARQYLMNLKPTDLTVRASRNYDPKAPPRYGKECIDVIRKAYVEAQLENPVQINPTNGTLIKSQKLLQAEQMLNNLAAAYPGFCQANQAAFDFAIDIMPLNSQRLFPPPPPTTVAAAQLSPLTVNAANPDQSSVAPLSAMQASFQAEPISSIEVEPSDLQQRIPISQEMDNLKKEMDVLTQSAQVELGSPASPSDPHHETLMNIQEKIQLCGMKLRLININAISLTSQEQGSLNALTTQLKELEALGTQLSARLEELYPTPVSAGAAAPAAALATVDPPLIVPAAAPKSSPLPTREQFSAKISDPKVSDQQLFKLLEEMQAKSPETLDQWFDSDTSDLPKLFIEKRGSNPQKFFNAQLIADTQNQWEQNQKIIKENPQSNVAYHRNAKLLEKLIDSAIPDADLAKFLAKNNIRSDGGWFTHKDPDGTLTPTKLSKLFQQKRSLIPEFYEKQMPSPVAAAAAGAGAPKPAAAPPPSAAVAVVAVAQAPIKAVPLFPASLNDVTLVNQQLGGSTGAKMVKDANENRFVQKTSGKKIVPEHLRAEFHTNKAYKVLGVAVPEVQIYEDPTTDKPVMLSKVVKGQDLGDYMGGFKGGQAQDPNWRTTHPTEWKAIQDAMKKSFVADCLLMNWDVAGLDYDNILYDPATKTAYRIDNGGALDFRAQGGPKKLDPPITEFNSLRNPNINPNTAPLFATLTDQEIIAQIDDILPRKAEFLAAFPDRLKGVMEQRFEDLRRIRNELAG